jgi:hypothetical protein
MEADDENVEFSEKTNRLMEINSGESSVTIDEAEHATYEIFNENSIPIAPADKLLRARVLCSEDGLGKCLKENGVIRNVLGHITLRQEIEIFKRWADGKLKESSALMLLREIRGDDSSMELSAIFNGESDGD